MTGRLLVVDDDEPSCRLIGAMFAAEGLDVVVAHNGPTGLERAAQDSPDVILLDVGLPGFDGLEMLERLKAAKLSVPVIMLTASRDVQTAVRAMQAGAFDYLTKPVEHDEVILTVRRAIESHALTIEVEELRRRLSHEEAEALGDQMGASAQVKAIVDRVSTVAATEFTVLISGETGTGKELVARALHRQSGRRLKPFVALDCGAIPEALLESELFGHERGAFTGADRRKPGTLVMADGGTCFLDEVGNLPMALQAKLLRVLESKEVQPVGAVRPMRFDVRFLAATNDNLQNRVSQGRFRSDLYFRLAQYMIVLPPLRERPDDVGFLAQRFLEEARVELKRPVHEIQPAALDLLKARRWPGNVRELRNVVRQAVLQSKSQVIAPDALLAVMTGSDSAAMPKAVPTRGADQSLREIAEEAARAAERQAIAEALQVSAGNKSKAAKALRTDYKTLHLKMKALSIRASDFKSS